MGGGRGLAAPLILTDFCSFRSVTCQRMISSSRVYFIWSFSFVVEYQSGESSTRSPDIDSHLYFKIDEIGRHLAGSGISAQCPKFMGLLICSLVGVN